MKRLVTFVVFVCLCTVGFQVQAQSNIIRIVIPDAYRLEENVFDRFTARYPDVQIEIVPATGNLPYVPFEGDIENYLNTFQDYVSSADVVFLDTSMLSYPLLQADYLLDLEPLIQNDATITDDVKTSPVWDAFLYQGQRYALPVAADVPVLRYPPDVLQAAGVNLPISVGTVADLEALFGSVAASTDQPLIAGADLDFLLSTLVASSETPADVIQWAESVFERVSDFTPYLPTTVPSENVFYRTNLGSAIADVDAEYGLMPLPNAPLTAYGFGVSRGTGDPEMAYALARQMMDVDTFAEMFEAFSVNALNNLLQVDRYTSEQAEIISTAFTDNMPYSTAVLLPYLSGEFRQIREGAAAADTTQNLIQLLDAQRVLAEQRQTQIIAVQPASPSFPAGPGTLRFGLYARIEASAEFNQALWEEVAAEFAATDPEIDTVVFDDENTHDCYYDEPNGPPTPYQAILGLDPLMATDPDFNEDDFIPGVLDYVRWNEVTLAYPFSITPEVIWYKPEKFDEAGLPYPENDWTFADFDATLQALQAYYPDEPILFFGDHYAQIGVRLLAAAQSVPMFMDNRPFYTSNLDNPDILSSFQYLRELIDAGTLDLASRELEGFLPLEWANVPLYAGSLYYVDIKASRDNGYRPVAIPLGEGFAPESYYVGMGMISNQTQKPEACYRWFQTLRQHPELFLAMPVRFSLLTDPLMGDIFGEDVAAFFTAYAQRLSDRDVRLVGRAPFDSDLDANLISYIFGEAIELEAEMLAFHERYREYTTCAADYLYLQSAADTFFDDVSTAIGDCAIAAELMEPFKQINVSLP